MGSAADVSFHAEDCIASGDLIAQVRCKRKPRSLASLGMTTLESSFLARKYSNCHSHSRPHRIFYSARRSCEDDCIKASRCIPGRLIRLLTGTSI